MATATRPSCYTREALADAVAHAENLRDVVIALRLDDSPYRRRYVSLKLRSFGLGRDHLRGSHFRYRPELLAEAAAQCVSVRGVVRYLEARTVGGTEAHVGRLLKKYEIDTSHFTGARHGRSTRSPERLAAHRILVKAPEGSGRTKARLLRRALDDVGVEARCEGCGTGPAWQGRTMTLEIDHINGDLTDNRRENLRYLCPNCHSTTDTYCRRRGSR